LRGFGEKKGVFGEKWRELESSGENTKKAGENPCLPIV